MNDMIADGLTITVLGMAIVFACLGLLWGLMVVLQRLLPASPHANAEDPDDDAHEAAAAVAQAEAAAYDELTAERARVAALVAGALMANAIPMLLDVPSGPVFEHGRTAPVWVSANRARALNAWAPPRADAGE